MEKFEMKKIVSILMIIMLVVAQADDTPSPSSPSYQTTSEASCLAECGFHCLNLHHYQWQLPVQIKKPPCN